MVIIAFDHVTPKWHTTENLEFGGWWNDELVCSEWRGMIREIETDDSDRWWMLFCERFLIQLWWLFLKNRAVNKCSCCYAYFIYVFILFNK